MTNIITEIFIRFHDLLLAPLTHKEMLWIAIPLLLTTILLELYFARYKFEELGWNSAYANTLVLVFVSIDLFRFLYTNDQLNYITGKNALAIIVAILGILLAVSNYLHVWSKDIAYGISGKLPINVLAYMSIILIYSNIPIDIITLIASLGILALFIIIILIIRFITPKAIELSEEEVLERERAPKP